MLDKIIDAIEKGNAFLNNIVWGWPVVILILGTGVLLSLRTGFLQLRCFRTAVKETIGETISDMKKKDKPKDDNSVSPFEAFAAAISGTVGTGNIIGVISAILTGGPGAVMWMWISAFFGMVTNFAENVLGIFFRKKDADGDYSGGAFYYIKYGLKCKWLAFLAAVFTILAALGMSGVQTNKISGTISDALSKAVSFENITVVKLVIGASVAVVTAMIILGGIQRIGKVASLLVPFMSLLFISLALIVIFIHVTAIPKAFSLIFENAFNFKAAGGGITGYAFATVIKKGMARGVFSNEAGLGSSVIAYSASENKEPVKQGFWGVFGVFFDTFIICTLTALMMLTSVDVSSLTGAENDATMAVSIFSDNFGAFGTVIFSLILPMFAFTTILAWSYYGEKATSFCFSSLGEKGKKISGMAFKLVYLVIIIASAVIESELVWAISDTCNGLMAVPNLIALVAMSGLVAKITKNYFQRKKGKDVKPMLSAYDKEDAD